VKKFAVLLLLLAISITHAEPLEDLEQAVNKVNLAQVKTLLQTTELSDENRAAFIDLAQQKINFSKGQLECANRYCCATKNNHRFKT